MQRTANNKKSVKKPNFKSEFDALGSYTGVSNEDRYEKPVQDADDL
jgi:hypothetical protein